jgi:transcriptional regulator with XRE-family HTH domain
MPTYTPHGQLKAIRKTLHKTQKQLAEMLGVSYPYLLSVETGQRDMSEPLARKITWLFGLASSIRDKQARPMTWDRVAEKRVPFSSDTFRKHSAQLPTFRIPDDSAASEDRVTPTLKGYTKAFHALVDSAVSNRRLGAVLESFFKLFAENVSSDAAIDAFQASYRKLYPGDKGDAQRALIAYIYDIQESQISRPKKSKKTRKRKRV